MLERMKEIKVDPKPRCHVVMPVPGSCWLLLHFELELGQTAQI